MRTAGAALEGIYSLHGGLCIVIGVATHVLPPLAPATTRVWIDPVDVDSQKWFDYAKSSKLPMSLVYAFEGRRLRKLEARIADEADRLLVVTEAERQLFLSFCDNAPIQAVGNGVDLEIFSPAERRPIHSRVRLSA